jgi:threonylcarbamoyladenosine tRNA methylthiotransferase MtaB
LKIAFATLGCKVNQFDTALMSEEVANHAYEIVSYDDFADLYVVNTCTVTDHADQESRHWVKKALFRNPSAKIVVTGCYAQTNPDEVSQIPGVNLVLGNIEKNRLATLIDLVNAGEKPVTCVGEIAREKLFRQPHLESFLDKTRAFLKIQDGCNSWCSFCIIPAARGRSRSFSIEEVIAQVRHFESIGYREVVLSGINLGSYGFDFQPKSSLLDLLTILEKETESIRFRFSSIEPELLSDKLIERLTDSARVCRHFHIPLQSGDDRILKRMSRRYDSQLYHQKIKQIRQRVPDASLGADVMVGFPAETEESFQNTCRFIGEIPLTYLHVFPFSAREGTEAFSFSDRIPEETIKERADFLRKLGKQKERDFYDRFIGREVEVLVEGRKETEGSVGLSKGLTDTYLKVVIEDGENLKQNDFVRVIPFSNQNGQLIARLLSKT